MDDSRMSSLASVSTCSWFNDLRIPDEKLSASCAVFLHESRSAGRLRQVDLIDSANTAGALMMQGGIPTHSDSNSSEDNTKRLEYHWIPNVCYC